MSFRRRTRRAGQGSEGGEAIYTRAGELQAAHHDLVHFRAPAGIRQVQRRARSRIACSGGEGNSLFLCSGSLGVQFAPAARRSLTALRSRCVGSEPIAEVLSGPANAPSPGVFRSVVDEPAGTLQFGCYFPLKVVTAMLL